MGLLPYTEDHIKFRDRLHRFCMKSVIPFVGQWEKDHMVPKSVWQKMGHEGFLCTAVAPEFGGLGGDFLYSVIALEEVAKTNHYGLDAFLHSDIVVPYIDAYGTLEQKQRYLPGCVSGDIITAVAMTEPGTGSDLASMETTAVDDGDSVIINGTKTFISNGVICDLIVLAAKDSIGENPYKSISLYLVDTESPGLTKGEPFDKLGVRSQDTNELFFSNCRVPKANRLGEAGSGFVKLMQKLQQERLLVALLAAFKAEFVLEWTIDHLKKRGTPPQAVQFALAEMTTELKLIRTFLDELVVAHMQGVDIEMETSMAKYSSSEMANRITSRCLDVCGPYGMLEMAPIVRTFRDLKVTPIFAGTNEIMRGIIAKHMHL
jgi:alkylation response protein AidB-like acyl-CoA dehydrogenase